MPTLRNIIRNQTAKIRSRILSKFYTNKPKSKSIPRLSISELKRIAIANKIAKSPKQSALITQIQKSYKKKLEKKLEEKRSRATRRITNAARKYRTRLSTNPDECAICLGPMFNPALRTTLYYCKHTFHSTCIKNWATNKLQPRCPICRTRILYYENPTIVKPTLNQQLFIRKLKRAQERVAQEVAEIAKANAIIREATIALKNRKELDGSIIKMTRKTMEKLQEAIHNAKILKSFVIADDARKLVRDLENELIANRIREREIVTRADNALLHPERDSNSDSDNDSDSDSGSHRYGGARCANCLNLPSIL